MQILNRHALCTFLALASIGSATAQTSEEEDLAQVYGDKSNVSIATGSSQPISKAPSSATVITAEDIRPSAPPILNQVMESVPGVHVSVATYYSLPIYSFRGIHTENNPQVLMMVNGLPITAAYAGDRGEGWGGMPLGECRTYRSNPGAGIGAIWSRCPCRRDQCDYQDGIGHQGYRIRRTCRQLQYQRCIYAIWRHVGALDASFYLREGHTNGSQAILQKDAQSHFDALYGTHDSLAPGPLNTLNNSIDARADLSKDAWRFRASYQHREVGMNAGLAGALDPGAYLPETRRYMDLSYTQANWAQNWDVSGVVRYYQYLITSSEIRTMCSFHQVPLTDYFPRMATG